MSIEGLLEEERSLIKQGRSLEAIRSAALEKAGEEFRNRNPGAGDISFPLSKPEKEALIRDAVGPVDMLPEQEEKVKDIEEEYREARKELADLHSKVFRALSDGVEADLDIEKKPGIFSKPYLYARLESSEYVSKLEVDSREIEGFVFRNLEEYDNTEVEDTLQVLGYSEDLAEGEGLGYIFYDISFLDYEEIAEETDTKKEFNQALKQEILEIAEEVDCSYINSDGSPILVYTEIMENYFNR